MREIIVVPENPSADFLLIKFYSIGNKKATEIRRLDKGYDCGRRFGNVEIAGEAFQKDLPSVKTVNNSLPRPQNGLWGVCIQGIFQGLLFPQKQTRNSGSATSPVRPF